MVQRYSKINGIGTLIIFLYFCVAHVSQFKSKNIKYSASVIMKEFTQLKPFKKKSKKGFNGYPLATMAFYGLTNRLATKLVLGITNKEGDDPELFKWFSEQVDVRSNSKVITEVLKHLKDYKINSILINEKLMGCVHEQDIDYEGEYCPKCPYWQNRDRITHVKIEEL